MSGSKVVASEQYFWDASLALRYAISYSEATKLLMLALMGFQPAINMIEWLVKER